MTGKTPSLLFGISRASLTSPKEGENLLLCDSRAEEENPVGVK